MAALRKQLDALKAAEDGRVRRLNTLLSSVSLVSKDLEWATVSSVEDSLNKANQLTKNENERAAVLETTREFDLAKASLREVTDKRFTDELDSVRLLMRAINKEDEETYTIPIERLTAALEFENISTEVESQGRAVLGKLTTERDLAAKNRLIEMDLAAIGRNTQTVAKFETALTRYVRNHAGSQRANELEDVQRLESKLWDGVNEWGRFRRKMPKSLVQLTHSQAKDLLADYEEFRKYGYPGATVPELQLKAIQAIARRTTSLTGTEPEIARFFEGPFMRDCYVLKLADGWYYGDSKPRLTTGRVAFDYFENGFSEAADGQKAVKTQEALNRGTSRDSANWLSSQAVIALDVDQILIDKKLDFEQKITSIMGLLVNAKEMDPILRLLLIENVLSVGGSGSEFIQQELRQIRESLARLEVPRTADWVNPETNLKTERGIAQRAIADHADLITKALAAAIKLRDKTFEEPIGPELQLAGWVHRDKTDRWRITLHPNVRAESGAGLFMPYLQNGKPALSIVGRTSSAETILSGSVPSALLREGRPVYLVNN